MAPGANLFILNFLAFAIKNTLLMTISVETVCMETYGLNKHQLEPSDLLRDYPANYINNICHLLGRRSKWGKTVPKVMSTARDKAT